MEKFKKIVQNTIIIFTSREFAFIYCVFGAIAQVAHTYYLTEHISSLTGYSKVAQATVLSIFISTSLLYFTSISTDEETKSAKKIRYAVTLFMVIEILINSYYYSRYLLLEKHNNGEGIIVLNNWFDFIFAVLISCMIPVTLKLYSSHIRAKEWLDDAEKTNTNDVTVTQIDDKLIGKVDNIQKQLDENDELFNTKIENFNEKLDNKINEFKNDIDNNIKNSFEKHSKLFINQYENKIKNISNG